METSREYQNYVTERLIPVFGNENVIKEWDVARGSQDDYLRSMYCPRIDIAIGPFNISRELIRDNQNIDNEIRVHRNLLRRLLDVSETDVGSVDEFLGNKNRNPRCFMAIEIEKTGTRKHMLGDIANASIVASIGIVVPLNDSMLNGFKGIKKYLEFASAVGKVKSIFNNVLVVNRDNFIQVIEEYNSTFVSNVRPITPDTA